jgi:cystathionine beta-lyase/cystathionine gamma-synthase
MKGFGGMVSFKIKGSKEEASEFFKALKLFNLTLSLGGVESLACYPVVMTHGTIPEEKKQRLGITNNLIRLSVGIENIKDILADLEQALAASAAKNLAGRK